MNLFDLVFHIAKHRVDMCAHSLLSQVCIAQFQSCYNIIVLNDINIAALFCHQLVHQGNVKSWKGRSHLTAMLSEDDGETWPYTLLLDERNEVSYPDAKEADNGYIYVTYDWERVTQREILMARFTEDDILRGKILSPEGKLRVLVNKALGQPDIH